MLQLLCDITAERHFPPRVFRQHLHFASDTISLIPRSHSYPLRGTARLATFALIHALQKLEEKKKREANMTEVSFAKTFLTTLDNKSTKYQPDHIFDPTTFGVRIPVCLTPHTVAVQIMLTAFAVHSSQTPFSPAPGSSQTAK